MNNTEEIKTASEERVDLTTIQTLKTLARGYQNTKIVLAIRIDEPFLVRTRDGQVFGEAGDYLIIGEDDTKESPNRWVIRERVFQESYRPASKPVVMRNG